VTKRRPRGRRIALAFLLLLLVMAGVALVVASSGSYEVYSRTALLTLAEGARAPAWTRSCAKIARWTDRAVCARVRGRVVWIERRDPDGDGDRHLIVVAHRRVYIVKVTRKRDVPLLPDIGHRIDAVGYNAMGAHGREELDALHIVTTS
jgi:hypothetical protein